MMPPPIDGLYADHSYKLVVTTAVSFVLATIGIVGRYVARVICRKTLELNDYMIFLGYVSRRQSACMVTQLTFHSDYEAWPDNSFEFA